MEEGAEQGHDLGGWDVTSSILTRRQAGQRKECRDRNRGHIIREQCLMMLSPWCVDEGKSVVSQGVQRLPDAGRGRLRQTGNSRTLPLASGGKAGHQQLGL